MLQVYFKYDSGKLKVCFKQSSGMLQVCVSVCFKFSLSSKHQVCGNALLFLPQFYRFEIQVDSQVFPAVSEGIPSLAQVIIENDRVFTFDLSFRPGSFVVIVVKLP